MGRYTTPKSVLGISSVLVAWALLLFGCTTTPQLPNSTAALGTSQNSGIGGMQEPIAAVLREFAHTTAAQGNVVVGVRETDYTFDNQGRVTTSYHLTYRVMTGAGVDGWSSISTEWEPWHELRPTVQARVIAPNGTVQVFDPSTEVEGSADKQSQPIFSDARTLRAPLPNVQVGSIVDEMITIRESKPGDPGGAYDYFPVEYGAPVLQDRLVVDLPDSLPFHYVIQLAPKLKLTKTRAGGRTRYVFAQQNVPVRTKAESNLPYMTPHWPHVSFSTAKSWNAVAIAYNRYVESAINSSNFSKEAAKLRGKDLESSVENIMAWMNERIRYTGLYQGNHSIIPTNPREVLARGYGDCKDKAVLLASILRAMGWKAHLALLWADDAVDAEPGLPSLGQFNHAIVYVSGKQPMWVDATEVYAKPTILPIMDQGRHALIISPSTKGLVQIPTSPATQNVITDTRDFVLQDYGYTSVEETIAYSGSTEEQARSDDDGASQKDLKKSWNQYVQSSYRFGKLVSFSNTDPRNLSTPFEEHVKISGAGRGYTGKYLSQAALPVAAIANWLPSILSSGNKSTRKGDFIFTEPLVYELHYVIHPPAGFTAEPLPEGSTTKMGTMTYSTSYSVRKDGTVDAYLTMNTGKTLLTPKEFEETRKAFSSFENKDMVVLNFDLDANTMLANGKYREAFKELRRLVSVDPNKPIQHLRYAEALLSVGLQNEAVKQVNIAIGENKKDADSYYTLGTILEHDVAGRLHGPSFDRDGAISAYKRAISLDPQNSQYKIALAHLYEYNPEGLRYGPGSDVAKAIPLYEQLKDTDSWSDIQSDYWDALVRADKWDTLRTAAANISKATDKAYYLILCDTFQKGVEAALQRASTIFPDTSRNKVLSRAGSTLFSMRQYSESYALFKRAVAGFPEKQSTKNLLKLLSTAKPHESLHFDPNDPKAITMQFITAMMTASPGHETAIKDITTPAFFELASVPGTVGSIETQMATMRAQTISSNLSRSVLTDLSLAAVKSTVKGSPAVGYQVNAKLTVSAAGGKTDLGTLFLLKDGNSLKIAAESDLPATIGVQVLDFLEKGDQAAATQWLDWATADITQPKKVTDPLSTSILKEFWRQGNKNAKVAAAVMMAFGDAKYAHEAYTILVAARSALHGTDRDRVDQALVHAAWNMTGEEQKALPFAEELYRDYPNSRTAFLGYAKSLEYAGEYSKAQEEAQAWLRHRSDSDPLEILINNRSQLISIPQAQEIMKERISKNSVTAEDYNQMAWFALFTPPVSQTALDYAQQAVTLAGSGNGAVANTLAAVYAAVGNVGAAYNEFVRELKLSNYLELQPEDWYVLGEIAEQCGLTSAAVDYYQRVTNTGQTADDPLAPYVLAQRRLAALR